MKNEKISVIIPVYNVEKYLFRCIDSVICQTYKNLEIILVDDGSPDNCGKICDEYELKDNRIKVIHKKNGGLSDARNFGIKNSTGKYLFFLDSDDFLPYDSISNLYNILKKTKSELAIGRMYETYDFFVDISNINDYKTVVKTYTNVSGLETMLYNSEFTNNACNKLYKKTLFDDIEFPVGKLYEDLAITYKIFAKAKKITSINCYTYCYFINRKSSIMNRKFDKKRMDALKFTKDIYKFVNMYYPDIIDAAISRLYMECLYIAVKIPYNKKYKSEIYEIKEIIKKYRVQFLKNEKNSKKQKIFGFSSYFGLTGIKVIWYFKEFLKRGK